MMALTTKDDDTFTREACTYRQMPTPLLHHRNGQYRQRYKICSSHQRAAEPYGYLGGHQHLEWCLPLILFGSAIMPMTDKLDMVVRAIDGGRREDHRPSYVRTPFLSVTASRAAALVSRFATSHRRRTQAETRQNPRRHTKLLGILRAQVVTQPS
jgi:hypothetical protein